MKQLTYQLALMASLFAVYEPVWAESSLHIGLVHEDMIIHQLEQQFQKTLVSHYSDKRKAVMTLEQNLDRQKNDYEKNKTTMSMDQMAQQELDLRRQERKVTLTEDNLKDEIEQFHQQWLETNIRTIGEQVKQVAEKKHLDLVLSDKAVLYTKNSQDITADVVSMMASN